jgi:hypothetical protein
MFSLADEERGSIPPRRYSRAELSVVGKREGEY